MIKFCDFLDEQKEYRLADVILGNFNKTAMRKTYHSNDISFEKIIDLSSMYVFANPNSIFMKTANTPDLGPTYKDIYNFLIKIGFKPDDFNRDIFMDIVKQKFRMYTRDLRGGLTPKEQKLYETIERTGFDRADGKRVITPDLRVKLNALAGLEVFTQSANPTGSVSRTPNQETSQPPKSNSGSDSQSTSPASKKSKSKTIDPAAMMSSENAAGKLAERKNLLITFFNKLKNMFPQLSSKLGPLANSVSKWGSPLIAACFLVPNAYYWITTYNSQGAEALDSWTEKTSFASFISAIFGTISLALGALSAAPTAGAGAVGGGSVAGIAYALSGIFSMGSWITQFFENDDPTDKLPKDKPTTKPVPQSGSSTKPTSSNTSSNTSTKPANKPNTSPTPQPPRPLRPANPDTTYGKFN